MFFYQLKQNILHQRYLKRIDMKLQYNTISLAHLFQTLNTSRDIHFGEKYKIATHYF